MLPRKIAEGNVVQDSIDIADIEHEPRQIARANVIGYGLLNGLLLLGAGILATWFVATAAFLTWGFR
jgi:hypothetical protein